MVCLIRKTVSKRSKSNIKMFDEQERMNEMWDDYFAKGDAIRERYASDIASMEGADEERGEYMQVVYDAGYGDDDRAYEANWKRTKEYAELNLN